MMDRLQDIIKFMQADISTAKLLSIKANESKLWHIMYGADAKVEALEFYLRKLELLLSDHPTGAVTEGEDEPDWAGLE